MVSWTGDAHAHTFVDGDNLSTELCVRHGRLFCTHADTSLKKVCSVEVYVDVGVAVGGVCSQIAKKASPEVQPR